MIPSHLRIASVALLIAFSPAARAATGCAFTLTTETLTAPATGGQAAALLLASEPSCSWTAASNSPFLTNLSAPSGTGSAVIGFLVAPNPNATPRTGTLTFGDRTFTVNQVPTGVDHGFSISPLTANFGAAGGNGSLNVTQLGPVGLWTASSAAPWVTITEGASGTSGATVRFTVSPNHSTVPRAGSLTIAGNTFAITQSGVNESGSRFVPLAPCRLADTRQPTGVYGGPILAANQRRAFPITGAGCGVPNSARAFSLHITVIPNGPLGYLTAWPTGQPQPFVSTLNSTGGRVVSNAAIIPAGFGRAIDIFVTNDTHVVLDIDGYFDAENPAALPFHALAPCRVVDTRNPSGPFGAPALTANAPRTFNISATACGIPPSAQAYSLNATVVPSEPIGFLTLWPSTQPQPTVSTLNSDGRVVANAAIVAAGISAAVNAFSTGATNLVLDANGYFGATGNTPALSYFPLTPCRVADTRNAQGLFGGPSIAAATSRLFPVTQSACGVPANASAFALNVTAVPHGSLQYLTIWPSGQEQPFVSTLNSFQGDIVANAAIVPAAADGSVRVFASDDSDVILDINGYFAPSPGSEPQNPPAFQLSVNPISRTIAAGETAAYEVTVTSTNGFSGAVALALINAPNNLSAARFSSDFVTVAPNQAAISTLILTAKPDSPAGASSMSIRAISPGLQTRVQDISLTVTAPANTQPAQVAIRQFQFSPTPVTIARGSQVIWTNFDGTQHTVVADGGQFTSTALSGGQKFTAMPATPGTYNYHCSIHPGMTGTVVVQ
ncbi:MAG: cupredoxin domain-containing protein [Acidobacteria bacterium]|nr:cupredoxin domain-containing protein [Acidobacteriota bacterium]